MLAIAALSHGWQAVLLGIALVVFLIAAIDLRGRCFNLVPFGLALITFVWFWAQLAAT